MLHTRNSGGLAAALPGVFPIIPEPLEDPDGEEVEAEEQTNVYYGGWDDIGNIAGNGIGIVCFVHGIAARIDIRQAVNLDRNPGQVKVDASFCVQLVVERMNAEDKFGLDSDRGGESWGGDIGLEGNYVKLETCTCRTEKDGISMVSTGRPQHPEYLQSFLGGVAWIDHVKADD
ncbi:MAG: hypothetical protein Q9165_000732 [Trypethelium subeluteriae]